MGIVRERRREDGGPISKSETERPRDVHPAGRFASARHVRSRKHWIGIPVARENIVLRNSGGRGLGVPRLVVRPVRKRSFQIDGESGFTEIPKLRRQFRTRRRLYAGVRQRRTSEVRPVGDFQLGARFFVSDRGHFLHPHPRRRRAVQRHGWIRKR